MKHIDQKQRDRHRKTYRLYFPHQLNEDSVTSWIRSISGTLRAHHSKLTGVPTVAFELWATSAGIEHRLKVPWEYASYVIPQLRALVPGIRVTDEEEFPRKLWTRAVEVGLTKSSRQLRIYTAATTAASLLASVQALEPGEAVLMQFVVTPAVPAVAPIYRHARSHNMSAKNMIYGSEANRDEVNDRRGKLVEPNVLAVLRIAALADTDVRADHLIYRIRASLASTRSPSTRFVKRMISKDKLQKRIDLSSGVLTFPMQLSASELAALIAWPIGNPFVSGLPAALARQLPTPDQVPKLGRVIGRSNFPGNERPVAQSFVDALKHTHIVGPTGVGKSVLMGNMLKHDIDNGHGVILIENKGDLFQSALRYIPWERLNDVIVLDVTDFKHPVGFNILQQGDPSVIVDEIVSLFEQLYKDSRGVWTREVLYHALRTLISNRLLTFVDLAALLVPMTTEEIAWADELIRNLRDRELRNFWQRFHNQPRTAQDRITQPVMDRIWQLNARPEIRNIIGQTESSFLMTDVIAQNKILLVNLAGIPRETASLTGTLLMNSIWHAVKLTHSDKPTFLYLDEFQDFVSFPVDAEDMLVKARSFGLGITLAHQHMGQLPTNLQQAVKANARTKIVFQTSSDDAKLMSREFGTSVTEHDFMHLGRYEAIARIATVDGVSAPLTLATAAPIPGYNFQREAINMSRSTYGRKLADVEKEINERRTLAKSPKTRRPSIGTDKLFGDAPPEGT